jgi:two-component system, sensor histidine kinase and response regulator
LSNKIMVVEDSGDLRELLGTGLVSLGWHPILAESGRESLAKLAHDRPRVILMDMGLGDMNGFELAAVLKRHPVYHKIAILGTTAYPGCRVRQNCLAAGCDDFISKPFGLAALQRRLTHLVYGERLGMTTQPG